MESGAGMSVPIPGKDGVRRYGRWAGNPSGHREKSERCIEEVVERARWINFYQCLRKRGYGKDNAFCRQHAKLNL